MFSDKLKKINQNGWTQERLIVITTDKIFNIHKYKVKRVMEIDKLGGISILTHSKKNEITIHFPDEYDYRFDTQRYVLTLIIYMFLFS